MSRRRLPRCSRTAPSSAAAPSPPTGVAFGEAVFTTGMTGYQETVTDPSYAEQLVCFTAPMVGNYGVADARLESATPHARAVLMRRSAARTGRTGCASTGSSRSTRSTRARSRCGSATPARCAPSAVADERALAVADALEQVRAQPSMEGAGARRAGLDARAVRRRAEGRVARRRRRLRRQALDHAPPRARPAPRSPSSRTSATRTSSPAFDGVLLSNGPGDPGAARRGDARSSARLLGRVPILGICLGHQLLGLATGHATYKLPFGHRGANHPVLDRRTRARARHEPEPRLRGRAVRERRGDARLALRRHGRGLRLPRAARALGAVPPRGRPGPARRLADPRALGRGAAR